MMIAALFTLNHIKNAEIKLLTKRITSIDTGTMRVEYIADKYRQWFEECRIDRDRLNEKVWLIERNSRNASKIFKMRKRKRL